MSDDYVLVLLDDMLIRKSINQELITDALNTIKSNNKIAVINFEKNYRPADNYSEN